MDVVENPVVAESDLVDVVIRENMGLGDNRISRVIVYVLGAAKTGLFREGGDPPGTNDDA